jgi:hypothetical protein
VASTASGQSLNVRSGFIADSVQVGEPTPYFLVSEGSADQQVIHPDSTRSFFPFEFVRRVSHPTVTSHGRSYDSTVYWLRTFELDSTQSLSLPVLVLEDSDTTAFASLPGSIGIRFVVSTPPDPAIPPSQLELRSNTFYERVKLLFNYPLLVIVLGSVLVIAAILVAIFFNRIQRAVRRWRLTRDYRRFALAFRDLVEDLQMRPGVAEAQKALHCWKHYLERLEDKPFLKLTTREIRELTGDGELVASLQQIDRGLYGGAPLSAEAFDSLKRFALTAKERRMEEVTHG